MFLFLLFFVLACSRRRHFIATTMITITTRTAKIDKIMDMRVSLELVGGGGLVSTGIYF